MLLSLNSTVNPLGVMARKFRFKNHKKSGITVSKKDVEQGMDAKQMQEYAKILVPTAFKYGSN